MFIAPSPPQPGINTGDDGTFDGQGLDISAKRSARRRSLGNVGVPGVSGGTKGNSSVVCINAGRKGYRTQVAQQLPSALTAFHPSLILISAGFDGGMYFQGTLVLFVCYAASTGSDMCLHTLDVGFLHRALQEKEM